MYVLGAVADILHAVQPPTPGPLPALFYCKVTLPYATSPLMWISGQLRLPVASSPPLATNVLHRIVAATACTLTTDRCSACSLIKHVSPRRLSTLAPRVVDEQYLHIAMGTTQFPLQPQPLRNQKSCTHPQVLPIVEMGFGLDGATNTPPSSEACSVARPA